MKLKVLAKPLAGVPLFNAPNAMRLPVCPLPLLPTMMVSVVAAALRVMLLPRGMVPLLPAPSLRIWTVAAPRLMADAPDSALLPANCNVPALTVVVRQKNEELGDVSRGTAT